MFQTCQKGYGRRRPDTSKMMTLAARRAARYRGLPDHRRLLARWNRTISAEIWRRGAKMILACLPGDSNEAEHLLTGERTGLLDGDEDAGAWPTRGTILVPRI